MKLSITIEDIRSKSNLKNNQTLIFTKNFICCTKKGFTESYSGVLNDIVGFFSINTRIK